MTVDGTRITRAERQAQTRERLVEVARDLFLTEGYAATPLDKVAVAAGFSKGAVYSNFGGKDDLCLAVLDTIHEEVAGAVLGSLSGTDDLDEALTTFDRWADARIGDPDWSALEAEFAARSRRDPHLREALSARNARIRGLISEALRSTCEEHGLQLPLTYDAAADALFSLGVGLGLQRSLDPAMDVHVLSDVVRVIAGMPVPRRG